MEKGYADTVRDERTRLSVGLYQVRIFPDIGAEVSDLQMPKMWSNGADGKRGQVMTEREAKAFLNNLKVCIEEHPIVADWLVEIADRKTENSSEIPNNSDTISRQAAIDARCNR